MKIHLKQVTDSDWRTTHELFIDGETAEYIGNCEPEDAIIGRDLIDGDQIISYIQMGYDAAKRGEELEITSEEIDKTKE